MARGLFRSSHPLPSLSVTTFCILFAVTVGLALDEFVLVGLAVLFQQFSVGLSNDWLDAKRDKQVKRLDKPVAQGDVSQSSVMIAAFVFGAVALALSAAIGLAPLLWMMPMLAIGWIYNLWLKSTALSVVPYIIGFGILPAFITLSSSDPSFPPIWISIVAALFGVAAHFANALPDLLDDKQTGVRALPHILGQRASAQVIATTASIASLVLVSQSPNLEPAVAFIGLVLTFLLSFWASVLSLSAKPPRIMFHLLLLAALVNVVLLLLS